MRDHNECKVTGCLCVFVFVVKISLTTAWLENLNVEGRINPIHQRNLEASRGVAASTL